MPVPPENLASWQIYQPLIIGLGAVVLGTLGNTILEWYKQHLARKHAAESLRRALIEELKQAKETMDVNFKRTTNPIEGGSFIIPIQEGHPIYDGAISQLGLLEPNQIGAVVYAYAMLKAQVETIVVLGTLHRIEGAVLQGIVDAKWAEVLTSQNKDISQSLARAIDELKH